MAPDVRGSLGRRHNLGRVSQSRQLLPVEQVFDPTCAAPGFVEARAMEQVRDS
jgi:hypothetical protein